MSGGPHSATPAEKKGIPTSFMFPFALVVTMNS